MNTNFDRRLFVTLCILNLCVLVYAGASSSCRGATPSIGAEEKAKKVHERAYSGCAGGVTGAWPGTLLAVTASNTNDDQRLW